MTTTATRSVASLLRDRERQGCRRLSLRRRPFVAAGAPKGVFWCHCQNCRRHSGTPDAIVFGTLATTVLTPIESPIRDFLRAQPQCLAYAERMRQRRARANGCSALI
jgi:hypothetical protein